MQENIPGSKDNKKNENIIMGKKAIVAVLIFIFAVVLTNFVSNTVTLFSEEEKYKSLIDESYVEYSYYSAYSEDYSIEPDYSAFELSSDDYTNPLYSSSTSFYTMDNGDFNINYGEYFVVDVNHDIQKTLKGIHEKVSIFDQLVITPIIFDNFYIDSKNMEVLEGSMPKNMNEVMIDDITADILFPDTEINDIIG